MEASSFILPDSQMSISVTAEPFTGCSISIASLGIEDDIRPRNNLLHRHGFDAE
jgi:hypothetical protein